VWWGEDTHPTAGREKERHRDKIHPSKPCHQNPTSFNQGLSPSFLHLPIMPSNFEFIIGLIIKSTLS
jgi:hypothetical protein